MVSTRMLLGLLAGLSASEAVSPEVRPSQPEEGRRIMRGETSRRGVQELDHDQAWAEVSPGTQAAARAWRSAADLAETKADQQRQSHTQASAAFDDGFGHHLKQQRKQLDDIKKKEAEEAEVAEREKQELQDQKANDEEEEKEATAREAQTERAAAGSELQRDGVPEPLPQASSVGHAKVKKPEDVDEKEQAEISKKRARRAARRAKQAANSTEDDDDAPKTHKQLMEAVLPSYFLAGGSMSCTTACKGQNMACDDQALKLVARMPRDCQWVLTRLGKAVNFGGTFPYDNSGCNYDAEGQGWYKVNKLNDTDPECDAIPANGTQRVCSCLNGTTADGYVESSHRRRVNRRRRHYWEADATPEDTRVGNFDGLREEMEVLDEGLDKVETELNGHLRANVAHVANLLGLVRERISLQSTEATLLENRVQALGTRDGNSTAHAIEVLQGEMVNLSNWMGSVEHGLFHR